MKKLFQFLIVVGVSLFLGSCYYDAFPEDVIVDPDQPTTDVSYQTDIVPLWAQCVGCHNGNESPNLQDNSYSNLLNGFVVPNDADASVLYKSLLGIGGVSLMPPGSQWSASKTDLVKNWINQGALNN